MRLLKIPPVLLKNPPVAALRALRAKIDETILLVVITEQGENRDLLEDQRNLFGFPHGFVHPET